MPFHRPLPHGRRAVTALAAGCLALIVGACDGGGSGMAEEPFFVDSAPTIAAEASLAPPDAAGVSLRHPAPPPRRAARAGVLTAGDIDDGLNLAAFLRYRDGAAGELRLPRADLSGPIRAQLIGPDGTPAPGLRVTLRRAGAAEPFYAGYSGVDGHVTVFPRIAGARVGDAYELRAFDTASGAEMRSRITDSAIRTRHHVPFSGGWRPDFLDLAFVVDTTGSMGDELAWLTRDLIGIVDEAARAAPGIDIRYGLVVYRDRNDAYVVRDYGFTRSAATMRGWLAAQSASGGGDYPEAAAAALAAGAALDWRRGKGERLLFHIADAPPHDRDARDYLRAAERLTRAGVQVFGLGASGVAAESELLMRQAAVMSNGRYLFLTDDSGVGNAHAEPTISCYRVTRLSGLVTRVLRSELSGRRVEAPDSAVLRQVGTYRRGICRD